MRDLLNACWPHAECLMLNAEHCNMPSQTTAICRHTDEAWGSAQWVLEGATEPLEGALRKVVGAASGAYSAAVEASLEASLAPEPRGGADGRPIFARHLAGGTPLSDTIIEATGCAWSVRLLLPLVRSETVPLMPQVVHGQSGTGSRVRAALISMPHSLSASYAAVSPGEGQVQG